MENFRLKFIEEANDLLLELEDALLLLEKKPDDHPLLERVFRVMHSLKGSGAMFGFERISEFTHHLESIYDLVRNHELPMSEELFNITLQSVDHIKLLLELGDDLPLDRAQEHLAFSSKIHDFALSATRELAPEKDQAAKEAKPRPAPKQGAEVFRIFFKPKAEVFNNGTNPIFLIDELSELGSVWANFYHSRVPALEALDTDKCLSHWELLVETTESRNALADVFIFVEDDSELEILPLGHGPLFHREDLKRVFLEHGLRQEPVDWEAFEKAIAGTPPAKPAEPPAARRPAQAAWHPGAQLENPASDLALRLEQVRNEQASDAGNQKAISTIRVSSDKLDQLMNLVSELVTTQARLSLHSEQSQDNELMAISEEMAKLSRQLRDNAFDICLIPIESMLTRFKRLIRDLSTEMGKEIEFVTIGTETELDKSIIENLVDPILHIIRNSIDHGIEPVEQRLAAGKPEKGHITLRAFYSGTTVNIEISDDGRGIDPELIRLKAVEKGLVAPDAQLSKERILLLVFAPGLSTAQKVTDVSGRGVGMDVVMRKITEIRGEVSIRSDMGVGTTMLIRLPLTLSIIDGLLVRVGPTNFVLPLSVVNKIYEVPHAAVRKAFNNITVLDGRQMPFLYLKEEFDMDLATSPEREQVVVVQHEEREMGLVVDLVVGEYQAVLKPLGKYFKGLDILSGATILGDGTVALVMDTNRIIKEFSNR